MKDKTKITPEYEKLLRMYMKEMPEKFFSPENEARSWSDFCHWPDSKTDRAHLCMPSEPMVIDRNYKGVHTYCICTISEKNKITTQIPVIRVDEIPYGIWKNGYFLLPDFKL